MASSTISVQDLITEYYVGNHATISSIESLPVAICTVTAAYIPMAEFEQLLKIAGELIKRTTITKFIFDKRKLTAFHLPSMEYYHLVWKVEMYKHGLKSHRKLLPNDKVFQHYVQEARKKIRREYPWFDFEKYDIVYCNSIEEALEK
jgi:hypothetical protein